MLLWVRQARQSRVEAAKKAGVQGRTEGGRQLSGTAERMTNDSGRMGTLMGAVRGKVTGGCELGVHERAVIEEELVV